jgi:hypothetical protein
MMKQKMMFAWIAVLALVAMTSTSYAVGAGPRFQLGGGLVISPDYRNALDDAYPDADITGGYGFVGFSAGLAFKLNEQFSITPKVDFMFNYVLGLGDDEGDDDSFLNTIVLPGVVARFQFAQAPALYIGGEVNYNIPNSGSDRMDMSSGGVGYGALLGFAFSEGFAVEAGYVNIPVDIEMESYSYRYGRYKRELNSDTYNMGGGVIRFIGTF